MFFAYLVLSLTVEIGKKLLPSRVLAALAIVALVLAVAYVTLADRKGIAMLQRRVGPNAVGS